MKSSHIDGPSTSVTNDAPTLNQLMLIHSPFVSDLLTALRFYADPHNWIDTPSWEQEDQSVITPKAIPVTRQDEGAKMCDCGDVARAVLSKHNFGIESASGNIPKVEPEVCFEDIMLLAQLRRDNVAGGARPVIESKGWDQARRLSKLGMIAIEQIGIGGRLHITERGVAKLHNFESEMTSGESPKVEPE